MKILIADDHELFLKGLEIVLNDMYQETSLFTAKSYDDIFRTLENEKNFDLILTDLAMPGASWSDGIERIKKSSPHTPIIIISAVFEPKVVTKTIEYGVSGFIHKTSSNEEIKNAIRTVLSGSMHIPPELLTDVTKETLSLVSDIRPIDDGIFTQRQKNVMDFISQGLSNKQIAFELGITEGTVKSYITEVFKKLGVNNRTSALVEANKRGLIK